MLSYRDVEELLAERARHLLRERAQLVAEIRAADGACGRFVLGQAIDGISTEMVVRIAGKRMYLWRAVDHEGEILDVLVQRRRVLSRRGRGSYPFLGCGRLSCAVGRDPRQVTAN
jgi:putative transposase